MLTFQMNNKVVGKFEPFSDFKDRLKWHKLIDYIDTVEDLTSKEKENAKKAYVKLSQILGKNFLIDSSKHHHYLFQHFLNVAPDAIRWSIWLADALEQIRNTKDGQLVIDRIRSKQYSHEGLAILQLVNLLNKVDFMFEYETKVIVKNRFKFPDLKLTNKINDQVLYLEISNLNLSDKHGDNSAFSKVSKILALDSFFKDLHYCGTIEVDNSKVGEATKLIEKAKTQVTLNKSFVEINGLGLNLGLAHNTEIDKLKSWAEKNDTRIGSISGGSISLDSDIHRLKNKIYKKSGQLAENQINIIVIPMHSLFMIAGDKSEMYVQVIEFLRGFPKIGGVLIFGNNPLSKPNVKEIFGGHFIANHQNLLNLNSYMYINNENAHFQMNPETWDLFHNAFNIATS